MFEESSGTHRSALPAMSSLAVIISLYICSAGFFPANQKSFASALNAISTPQRCGDNIFFFFSDQTGKSIDPADFESIMLVFNGSYPGYKLNIERKGMKGFVRPTLCGHEEMKVTIAYRNKKMELILRQIPGDQGDIYLYSIPFSEGAYAFDFEYNLNKSCHDNVEDRRGKCILPPKRLKKITPDSRKQEGAKEHARKGGASPDSESATPPRRRLLSSDENELLGRRNRTTH